MYNDRMSFQSDRLARLIEQSQPRITQRALAKEIGVSPGMITNYLSGDKEPSTTTLAKLAKYFGVSIDYLINETLQEVTRTPISPRRVPILGNAACGKPILAEQNIEGYIELPGELAPGQEIAAIRVVGDSMQGAHLYDGMLAIIRLQEQVENGEIAVICVGDDREEAVIKKYQNVDGYVTLYSMPATERREEFPPLPYLEEKTRVIGRVAGVWWG